MRNWLIGLGMIVAAAVGAVAQTNPGTVSNHSVLVSPGPGVVGYRGAAPGTAGNCLTSNGASSDPSFQTCAGGADITAVTISSTDGTIGVSGSPCLSGNCAFDLGPLGANSVSTTNIQSGAVTQPKIATNAITTTAIIDNAVTNAKLATVSNNTIKSNVSGGAAVPSDNTLSAILDSAVTTTQGAIIYRGASTWQGLDPSTATYVLSTNGPGADPSWVAAGSGSGDITAVTITSTNSTLNITGSPCLTGACAFTADAATASIAQAQDTTNTTNIQTPSSTTATIGIATSRAGGASGLLTPSEGLRAFSPTAATVNVSSTAAVLFDTNGQARRFTSFNVTPDITASGANGLDTGAEASSTWYYIWLIAKIDGTEAGLFSTSATAPTMPAGYVYKGLVGAVYNNGSSNFRSFYQVGNRVSINIESEALSAGSATSYTAVNLAAFVPPNATAVTVRANLYTSTGTADLVAQIVPEGGGSTTTYGIAVIRGQALTSAWGMTDMAQVIMSTAQQIKYLVAGTNARLDLGVPEYWY